MEQANPEFSHSSLTRLKWTLILLNALVMFVFLFSSQLFVYFNSVKYDLAKADVAERLRESFSTSVVFIYIFVSIVLGIIIARTLKPLFDFVGKGESYNEARIVSVKLPWRLLYFQIGFWLIGVTVFFILRHWELSSGYSVVMVYLQKFSVGIMASVYSAQIINLLLIPLKKKLDIQNIREKEYDFFTRFKDYFIFSSIFFTFFVYYGSFSSYLYQAKNVTRTHFDLTIFLLTLVLSVLSISLVLFSKRERNLQMDDLKQKVKELSQGHADLSKRVNILIFDRIGEVAKGINDFMQKLFERFSELKTLILQINNQSNRLSESSARLTQRSFEQQIIMDSISTGTEKFSAIMEKVKLGISDGVDVIKKNADFGQKLNHGLNEIIGRVEELNATTFHNKESVEKGFEVVNHSMESIFSMNDDMKEIAEKIKSAGDQSERIDEIVSSIQNIAENTNILSMNAAIEAAHAGKAGEGFAIVAQEIRELAEMSAKSAQNISDLVYQIKQSIIEAVAMAAMGETKAEDGEKRAGEARQALKQIMDNIGESEKMIAEINHVTLTQGRVNDEFFEGIQKLSSFAETIFIALEEQNMQSQNIQNAIGNLNEKNNKNTDAAQELAALSDELARLGDTLTGIFQAFIPEK